MAQTTLEKTVKHLIKTNKSLADKMRQSGQQICQHAFVSIKHRIDELIDHGMLNEDNGTTLTIDLPFAVIDYAEGRKTYQHLQLECIDMMNDIYTICLVEGEYKRRIMFPQDWVWLYQQLDRMGFWNDRYKDFTNKTD